MPPKAVFSSIRTQELYEILQSFGEEQEPVVRVEEKQGERQLKDKPKKLKGTKKKKKKKIKVEMPYHNSPKRIPKFIKTDRWTIESSSSRSSKSTSKNKHPFTTRNHYPSNNYTPRSNLINIVDHNQSLKASIIQLNHSFDSYRRKSRQKAKSRLFSKNKLESIKKTLEFIDVQTKKRSTVYDGIKLHSLAKGIKERSWIQFTNQASQASFLWVDYPGFLQFQKLRMQEIKRGDLPNQSQSYLINHLPLDCSEFLWQITNSCEGRCTPKIVEIMQGRRMINYKSIISSLQRWEGVKYWIVKPLEKSNFQNSHICYNKEQIKQQLKKMAKAPSLKGSYIVQQYINNPVLYNSRKFSIKSYLLITSMDHTMKGYLYDELLIQTSSLEYREDSTNLCVHFTGNDIQRQGKHYGRYEEYNRISEQQLANHLQILKGKDKILDFKTDVRQISIDLADVIINKIANHYDCLGYFQLFQLDFLLDKDFNAILISIDQQPDLTKKHKEKYTDRLVEDVLKQILPLVRLTLDLQIPPPLSYFAKHNSRYKFNHFETIYDSRIDKNQAEPAKK